jgi:riboflavin synthase
MFTGIIEATGTVRNLQQVGEEYWLTVKTRKLDLADVKVGDSIAVDGCCLTVVDLGDNYFSAYVSQESLRHTTLGSLERDSRVNLEKAMLASSRFSGHIVSGHVDGVGAVVSIKPEGKSLQFEFELPSSLAKYTAAKGSICVDGVSLTINTVSDTGFSINVIPHTQDETVIADYSVSQQVNIEVDLVARYLERLIQAGQDVESASAIIDMKFLKTHGFQST